MSFDWWLAIRFLHLFFAFAFVGSLVVLDWNGRAARATNDWAQRAVLFRICFLSANVAGLGGLILTGVLGNLLAVGLGWRMSADSWMHWANGLWVVCALVMAFVTVPSAAVLERIAKGVAAGDANRAALEAAYAPALARFRIGNVAVSVFYLALLAIMVFRWRA